VNKILKIIIKIPSIKIKTPNKIIINQINFIMFKSKIISIKKWIKKLKELKYK
jgi:hypothetical protein